MVDKHGLNRCSAHDRKFSYICMDHATLYCKTCHLDFHQSCQHIYCITDMATNVDGSLIGSADNVHNAISSARYLIEKKWGESSG